MRHESRKATTGDVRELERAGQGPGNHFHGLFSTTGNTAKYMA